MRAKCHTRVQGKTSRCGWVEYSGYTPSVASLNHHNRVIRAVYHEDEEVEDAAAIEERDSK